LLDYEHWIVQTAHAVELIGVLALLAGAGLAFVTFCRRVVADFDAAYQMLRADLGRAILLGLELLVIADIIGTVAIDPTLENLGVLAAIVGIRTFLSFVLELDVSGSWPWRRAHHQRGTARLGEP